MENRGHRDSPPQAGVRLDWIDVARGIGIVAVVVAHVWTRGPVRDALYAFHMPLFFLLSGMVSRPHPPAAFAWRQLRTHMRPYAAYLLLLLVIDLLVERLKGHRPMFHQWPDDLLPILLGGTWLRGPFTIFWFVPCLMLARIIFNMVQWRWPRLVDWRWGGVLLVMLALSYAPPLGGLPSPLGMKSVPMAIVLLWVGALWSVRTPSRPAIVAMTIAALAGLSGLLPTLNMKAGDYGAPLLSMIAAIAASLLLVLGAKRAGGLGRVFTPLGRASLVIMYLHVAVIHYLSPYFARPVLLVLALGLPLLAYHLIARTALRPLFL